MGVNHFGHFLLTNLLLEKLKASPEPRVVNVSSGAHNMSKFDFDDLHFAKTYSAFAAYARSKLANIYFSREMAKREPRIKVCSLDPGPTSTDFNRYLIEGNPCCMYTFLCCCMPLSWLVVKTPWWGAQTSLHCCLVPFSQLESGKYYQNCRVVAEKFGEKWEEESIKLWEVSEETIRKH
jgi:retinol dehydrogenase-13